MVLTRRDKPAQRAMIRKLLLAAVAALAALALSETFVRAISLAPPVKPIWLSAQQRPDLVYMRSTNPILGFELKPNYRNDHPDQESSYTRTNAHGQRDVERQTQKPPHVRRIILLGDSVVEGHGIVDLDETLSRQLESLYPNGSTEVLNFGVSGYSTLAEIELLETKGLKFRPDVVIVVFVENDFHNFTREAFQLEAIGGRPAIIKHLFVASHLFRLTCIRFNIFHFGMEADPVRWNNRAIGDNNVDEGLKRLRLLAGEHGFRTLLAIWPKFTDDGIEDVHPVPNGDGELVVEHLAKSYGIPTVRLSRWFGQDMARQAEDLNPRLHYCVSGDGLHPSKTGCRVAAGALKAILADLDAGRYALADPVAPAADVSRSEAVRAARAMGKKQPSYAFVYGNVGLQHQQSGDWDKAIHYYRLALASGPDKTKAMNNLGVVLLKQGKFAEAAEHFTEVLDKDPDNILARRNYGTLLMKQRKFAEAEAQFNRVLRLNPNMAAAHRDLGSLFIVQGKLDQAAARWRRAVELNPDDFGSHYNLGATLETQGKPQAAAHHYEHVLRIKSDFHQARLSLGMLSARIGNLAEAAAQLDGVVRVQPENADAHFHLGQVLRRQQKLPQAAAAYKRSVQLRPDFPEAREALAQVESILRGRQLQ